MGENMPPFPQPRMLQFTGLIAMIAGPRTGHEVEKGRLSDPIGAAQRHPRVRPDGEVQVLGTKGNAEKEMTFISMSQ